MILFALSMLSIGHVGDVHASSFGSIPFSQRVDRAFVILRGKTGPSRNAPGVGEDGARRAYTVTDFEVTEVFRGTAQVGERIQVREAGGEIDGNRVEVDGAAHFTKGEDVVLFLEPGAKGIFGISGMSHGVFRVVKDGEIVLKGPGYAKDEKPWSLDALKRRAAMPPSVAFKEGTEELKLSTKDGSVSESPLADKSPARSPWRWYAAGALVVLLLWRSRLRRR